MPLDERSKIAAIYGLMLNGEPNNQLEPLDGSSRDLVRNAYRAAIRNAKLELDTYEFARLPERFARMQKPDRVAAITTFTLTKLPATLREHGLTPEETVKEVLSRIEAVRIGGKGKISTDDILTVLRYAYRLVDPPKPVDSFFVGEFMGYRRSVTHGDLVHFFIRIYLEDSRNVVRFENHYHRPPHFWVAEGIGFQVGDTLYMEGNAHNGEGADTRGLRSFGLQRLGTTDCLVGPVMTSAPDRVPMCARIALVPVARHHAWADRKSITRKEMRDFVEGRFSEAALLAGLARPFRPEMNDYLLSLVDNTTTTVLRGLPRHNKAYMDALATLGQYAEEQGLKTMEDALIKVMEPIKARMADAPKGT